MPLLTQTISHFRLNITFAGDDTNGARVTRRKQYEIIATGADDDAKFADARATTDAFLTDLGAMTEAEIIGHELVGVYTTAVAVSATNINLYKELVLSLEAGLVAGKALSHAVPAPADAILSGGKVVLWPSTAVGDYLANMLTAGKIRISDGEYISGASNPILASRVKTVSSGKTYG